MHMPLLLSVAGLSATPPHRTHTHTILFDLVFPLNNYYLLHYDPS